MAENSDLGYATQWDGGELSGDLSVDTGIVKNVIVNNTIHHNDIAPNTVVAFLGRNSTDTLDPITFGNEYASRWYQADTYAYVPTILPSGDPAPVVCMVYASRPSVSPSSWIFSPQAGILFSKEPIRGSYLNPTEHANRFCSVTINSGTAQWWDLSASPLTIPKEAIGTKQFEVKPVRGSSELTSFECPIVYATLLQMGGYHTGSSTHLGQNLATFADLYGVYVREFSG